MTGLATDMLQQQSATYIQRGQAFMQQRMGFLSTDVMHYFFNLNSEYGKVWHPLSRHRENTLQIFLQSTITRLRNGRKLAPFASGARLRWW